MRVSQKGEGSLKRDAESGRGRTTAEKGGKRNLRNPSWRNPKPAKTKRQGGRGGRPKVDVLPRLQQGRLRPGGDLKLIGIQFPSLDLGGWNEALIAWRLVV